MLVSSVQQSDSVIHIPVFFIRFFSLPGYYALLKIEVELIYGASLMAQMVKNLPAMQETWVWSLGWEDPLEKEMTTHSSILSWRIPWTGEPGELQSIGLQRVGHNWSDLACMSVCICLKANWAPTMHECLHELQVAQKQTRHRLCHKGTQSTHLLIWI